MKSWSGEDLGIVEKADLDSAGLRSWFWKLFGGNEVWKYLPERVRSQFLEEVERAYQQANEYLVKRMMLAKVRHTKDVVEAGFEITNREKEFEWNMTTVAVACFFHDIARFKQALLGSFDDKETGFDHGSEGAKMVMKMDFSDLGVDQKWVVVPHQPCHSRGLQPRVVVAVVRDDIINEENFIDDVKLGVNQEEVAEAIEQHNKFKMTKDGIYVKLVRDADKLALLRYSKLYIDKFCEKADGVTETALADYLAGKMVSNENVSTRNDVCLNWLSWEGDLNFSTTRKLFKLEGVKEWMFEDIRRNDQGLWERLSGAS